MPLKGDHAIKLVRMAKEEVGSMMCTIVQPGIKRWFGSLQRFLAKERAKSY